MKKRQLLRRISAAAVMICMIFSLCACGSGTAQSETSPEPTAAPTPSPEPTPNPDSPAGRAAALGLPEPPDVDISSWEFLLANSYNSLFDYAPPYGGIEGQGIDSRALEYTSTFLYAARAAGYELYLSVAYRNFDYLLNHYRYKIRDLGSAEEAAKVFCPPGCSDHQTGLAIDFTDDARNCSNYNQFEDEEFKDTEAYTWLCEHCAEYGFILRYPEGKEEYYGTACNHAHFRYVGVDAAEYITENDLCLEEFLLLYDEAAVYVPSQAK